MATDTYGLVGPDGTVRTRRIRRQNVALLVMASVLGLWLGVAAPSVSPVAPALPTGSAVSAVTAVPGPTVPGQTVPAPTVPTRGGRR